MHIGLLTDYIAPDITCGPAFASQNFYRNMQQRGHKVTMIGPRPAAWMRRSPPDSVELSAGSFRQYPGVRLTLPWPPRAFATLPDLDIVHSHANTLLMRWAPIMRQLHGVPVLHTNTTYLPEFAQHAIPKDVLEFEPMRPFWDGLTKWVEASFARVFNAGDGLIVMCQGLVDYWEGLGLQVPMHVIQRPIDVRVFNRKVGPDPFRPEFARGQRLVSSSRHSKEKSIDVMLDWFARHVLPACPEASLTLIGDGPAHASLVAQAQALGVGHRVDLPGEMPQGELQRWLGHADLFTYTSMCETFGQVISEALWMGLPVVARDDKMGVAHQVKHEQNGMLVDPKRADAGQAFAATIKELLANEPMRRTLGENAALRQRETSAPEVVYAAYEAAYASAREHYAEKPPAHVGSPGPLQSLDMGRRWFMPWTVQHAILLATGLGGTSYQPKHSAPLDAAPDNPADEAYAHSGGSSMSRLPHWMRAAPAVSDSAPPSEAADSPTDSSPTS